MSKTTRAVLLLTIFIIWIVVGYLVAPEQMNGFLIAGMGLVIIPQILRDMKPDLISRVVADILGFIGFNLCSYVALASWTRSLPFPIRTLFVLAYLGGCAYFLYKVYAWLKREKGAK